jgi:hypothetical protein
VVVRFLEASNKSIKNNGCEVVLETAATTVTPQAQKILI